jgi:hypothetical protein
MRSLCCLLLAAGLLLAAPAHGKLLRGLDPALVDKYNAASGEFTCLDGSKTIDFKYVNDNFCDCQDGSDEPGAAQARRASLPFLPGPEVTEPPPRARRHLRLHHRPLLLPQPGPHRQDDLLHLRGRRRVRWVAPRHRPIPLAALRPRSRADRAARPPPADCCDGSDERGGSCTNKCLEEAAAIKAALQTKLANYEAALAKKAEYLERAKVKRAEMTDRRASIDQEIEEQKRLIVELKGARRGGARCVAGWEHAPAAPWAGCCCRRRVLGIAGAAPGLSRWTPGWAGCRAGSATRASQPPTAHHPQPTATPAEEKAKLDEEEAARKVEEEAAAAQQQAETEKAAADAAAGASDALANEGRALSEEQPAAAAGEGGEDVPREVGCCLGVAAWVAAGHGPCVLRLPRNQCDACLPHLLRLGCAPPAAADPSYPPPGPGPGRRRLRSAAGASPPSGPTTLMLPTTCAPGSACQQPVARSAAAAPHPPRLAACSHVAMHLADCRCDRRLPAGADPSSAPCPPAQNAQPEPVHQDDYVPEPDAHTDGGGQTRAGSELGRWCCGTIWCACCWRGLLRCRGWGCQGLGWVGRGVAVACLLRSRAPCPSVLPAAGSRPCAGLAAAPLPNHSPSPPAS